MTNRQKAIAKAKEAYRLFITRGIQSKGFSVTDDEQHPYRAVGPIGGDGFVVCLKANGAFSWAYRATEQEDFIQ